jgi:curved DNA-binding protein CbpA
MAQSPQSPTLSFSDSCRLLGISEHVTEEDLKVAFHKKALQYHPDRFFNAPLSEQQVAERKFREAKTAYEQVASRFKSQEPGAAFFYPGPPTSNPVLKRRTNILIASGITLGCLLFAGAYTLFHMRPMYDHKRFISEGPEKAEQRRRMLHDRMQIAKARADSSENLAKPP